MIYVDNEGKVQDEVKEDNERLLFIYILSIGRQAGMTMHVRG